MVHLGPGVQYVAEGGRAYLSPSDPQDVVIETKKITARLRHGVLSIRLGKYIKSSAEAEAISHTRKLLLTFSRNAFGDSDERMIRAGTTNPNGMTLCTTNIIAFEIQFIIFLINTRRGELSAAGSIRGSETPNLIKATRQIVDRFYDVELLRLL
ncbi:hypothetical protein NQ315_000137 [Exocentrus adspersus]|uniref:Uncharacterized protein n=1 Tax=Exocentrus adspersus TaxID=1586481 RepID=A0AAV8VR16_9CUCU|nr:hypothetical protein NQ315_000137 [Exocentrus adspersus]